MSDSHARCQPGSDSDPLVPQLKGRAKFLRNKGGVKSPDLMDKAAARIEELEGALRFYADSNNYASGETHVRGMTRPVMQDYGRKANTSLNSHGAAK